MQSTGVAGANGVGTLDESKALQHLVGARLVVDNKLERDALPDLQYFFTSGFSAIQEERLDTTDPNIRIPRESWEVEEIINFPIGLQSEIERWKNDEYQFCFEGIFPEISHAWVTLDNRLFLWNYKNEAQDWTLFDELDQVIISVALVKPKPKVFIEAVKHLLVVATSVEIVLLAVVERKSGGINIMSTLMSIPSDNIHMLKIKGTSCGRVFMCGRDGNLFELHYQTEDTWFRKKIRKVNHTQSVLSAYIPSFMKITTEDPIIDIAVDDDRNLLYTLSDKSAITLYDLGSDGQAFSKVAAVKDVKRAVEPLWYEARSLQAKTFDVVSINAIPASESAAAHLVAITVSGIRLYFTSIPRRSINYVTSSDESFRRFGPSVLNLLHVRLPPSRSTDADERSMWLKYKVTEAFYTSGACVMADVVDGSDVLICTAPDNAAIGKQKFDRLYEQTTIIKTVKGAPRFIGNADLNHGQLKRRGELATQHVLPRLRLLCLTDCGLHVFAKNRPVDVLRNLLRQARPDSQEVVAFFQLYGVDQACATCLAIACASQQLSPSSIQTSLLNPLQCADRASEAAGVAAADAFFGLGGAAKSAQTFDYGTSNSSAGHVQFSGKVNGLALYLSRCLQVIWKEPFVTISVTNVLPESALNGTTAKQSKAANSKLGAPCTLSPSLYPSQIDQLQDLLVRLHGFLQDNPHFSPSVMSVPDNTQDAQQIEDRMVYSLHLLLKRSVQALAFVQILCDSSQRVSSAARFRIPADAVKSLQGLNFGDFVCTEKGVTASKQLVTSLIDYHTLCNNVSSISVTLEKECPLFFSNTDRIQFRAFEKLRKAANLSRHQAEDALLESLKEFKSIAKTIDIKPVFEEYIRQKFFRGAVDLLLTCAHAVDPGNTVMAWLRDGQKPNPALEQLCNKRQMYYDLVLQCLSATIEYTEALLAAEPAPQDPEQQMNHPAFRIRLNTLNAVFRCDDELAHRAVFRWFVENDAVNELLQLSSPYLEGFMKEEVEDPYTLYRYYVVNGRNSDATLFAYTMAMTAGNGLLLRDRLEYLARAIASSKECPASTEVNPADLDDVMEVALIQTKIYESLTGMAVEAGERQRILEKLDNELHNLSELYRVASRYKLWELVLEILHSAKSNYPRARARVRAVECWEHIVATEVSHDVNGNTFQKSSVLAHKVGSIGRQFHPSDWAFPVEDIVRILEEAGKPHRSTSPDIAWIVTVLHDQARVSYLTLINIYTGLFDLYLKLNATDDAHHVVGVCLRLANLWLRCTDRGEVHQRSMALADRLDNFMFALDADMSSSPSTASLLAALKEVRAQV